MTSDDRPQNAPDRPPRQRRITRYHTASGSVYEVERGQIKELSRSPDSTVFNAAGYATLRVRRLHRSTVSRSERVTQEWRDAESVGCLGVGMPLVIWWGRGRDEHSAQAEQVGVYDGAPDEAIQRCTQTTPVKHIEILGEAS